MSPASCCLKQTHWFYDYKIDTICLCHAKQNGLQHLTFFSLVCFRLTQAMPRWASVTIVCATPTFSDIFSDPRPLWIKLDRNVICMRVKLFQYCLNNLFQAELWFSLAILKIYFYATGAPRASEHGDWRNLVIPSKSFKLCPCLQSRYDIPKLYFFYSYRRMYILEYPVMFWGIHN